MPLKPYEYYVPPYEAVRQAASTYVRYADNPWTTKRDGFQEYYELLEDPHQLNNEIFYGTAADWRLRKAKGMLANLRTCRAEGCRTAEGFPTP